MYWVIHLNLNHINLLIMKRQNKLSDKKIIKKQKNNFSTTFFTFMNKDVILYTCTLLNDDKDKFNFLSINEIMRGFKPYAKYNSVLSVSTKNPFRDLYYTFWIDKVNSDIPLSCTHLIIKDICHCYCDCAKKSLEKYGFLPKNITPNIKIITFKIHECPDIFVKSLDTLNYNIILYDELIKYCLQNNIIILCEWELNNLFDADLKFAKFSIHYNNILKKCTRTSKFGFNYSYSPQITLTESICIKQLQINKMHSIKIILDKSKLLE